MKLYLMHFDKSFLILGKYRGIFMTCLHLHGHCKSTKSLKEETVLCSEYLWYFKVYQYPMHYIRFSLYFQGELLAVVGSPNSGKVCLKGTCKQYSFEISLLGSSIKVKSFYFKEEHDNPACWSHHARSHCNEHSSCYS